MEISRRIAVLGSEGMLGTDLVHALKASSHEVFPLDVPDIDIIDYDRLRENLLGLKPDVVINSAAYTDVDGCETNREHAFLVNGTGAGNTAAVATEIGATLIQISTDYVFDGGKDGAYLPDDPTDPLSIYGESKLEGESQIKEKSSDFLILRTSWLYGKNGKNFVETILKLAEQRDSLKVIDDQKGSPTFTVHMAGAIVDLLKTDLRGIHHLTNSGSCTWFEFAGEILSLKGIDRTITPCTTEEFPLPARRPANSVLDCSSTYAALGGPLPHWEESLREYLGIE
jgi:dTDP-4-dehydrorhamnose reductase